MAVGEEKLTPKVNGEMASEEQTSQKFVENVKTEIDGNEVNVGYTEDGEMFVQELPEGVDNEEEFLEKVKTNPKVQELGHTLAKYKLERTRQNELIKDYDGLREKTNSQADEIDRQKKELADRQKEIDLLKANSEENEYLKVGMNYETAYSKKLLEELGVKSKDEAAELMGTVEYLDASTKAMAFAQSESFKTTSRTSERVMRLQGKNTELSALVRSDGKVSPEKVIAFRDAQGISHFSPDDVYNYYLLKHPQQNLVEESNRREQKRSTQIKILKNSRVLPKVRLEDMPLEEAQLLIKTKPNDSRVIDYKKRQGI